MDVLNIDKVVEWVQRDDDEGRSDVGLFESRERELV